MEVQRSIDLVHEWEGKMAEGSGAVPEHSLVELPVERTTVNFQSRQMVLRVQELLPTPKIIRREELSLELKDREVHWVM